MTHQALTFAMARLGLDMPTCDCPCCGDTYDRDDMMGDRFNDEMTIALIARYGRSVCFGCADEHELCIGIGCGKAVKDGETFDTWTSGVLVIGYAVPGFLVAVLLLIMFAGSSFFQWFPSRGLTSDNWADLSTWGKIIDYFWHLTLPLIAIALGAFTTMTFLTKNSFLDEIRKQYVITARAKGLSERQVLYGHVFRNAMLLIIAGFPGAFISAFFSGSLLIEQVFSLDGLGLLGFESIINRDYPVVFATLYIFSLLGLVVNLVSDFLYTIVDPRIDFESREV